MSPCLAGSLLWFFLGSPALAVLPNPVNPTLWVSTTSAALPLLAQDGRADFDAYCQGDADPADVAHTFCLISMLDTSASELLTSKGISALWTYNGDNLGDIWDGNGLDFALTDVAGAPKSDCVWTATDEYGALAMNALDFTGATATTGLADHTDAGWTNYGTTATTSSCKVYCVTMPIPTSAPTLSPTSATPSAAPTLTSSPTVPTTPTPSPTTSPTTSPTFAPTLAPTAPTLTGSPTNSPSSASPTLLPSIPTLAPIFVPTLAPIFVPTLSPSTVPTFAPLPTMAPSLLPTLAPIATLSPSLIPSFTPLPTIAPSLIPDGLTSSPTTVSLPPSTPNTLAPSMTAPPTVPTPSTSTLPPTSPTPALLPTPQPTLAPTLVPTETPTYSPTPELTTVTPGDRETSVDVDGNMQVVVPPGTYLPPGSVVRISRVPTHPGRSSVMNGNVLRIALFVNDSHTNVQNLTQNFTFQIPLQESFDGCTNAVTCSWWDSDSQEWSPSGCSSIVLERFAECSCNHLTDFALLLNGREDVSLLRAPHTAFVVVYAILLCYGLAAIAVMVSQKLLREHVTLQHLLVVLVCVTRILSSLNYLGTFGRVPAAVFGAISALPFLLEMWALSLVVYQWLVLVHFGMKPTKAFTRLRPVLALINVLFACSFLLLFIALAINPLSVTAVAGTALLAVCTIMLAVAFVYYSQGLVKELQRTTSNQRRNGVKCRILVGGYVLMITLSVQAFLSALALHLQIHGPCPNNISQEVAHLTTGYLLLDVLSLCVIYMLYASAIVRVFCPVANTTRRGKPKTSSRTGSLQQHARRSGQTLSRSDRSPHSTHSRHSMLGHGSPRPSSAVELTNDKRLVLVPTLCLSPALQSSESRRSPSTSSVALRSSGRSSSTSSVALRSPESGRSSSSPPSPHAAWSPGRSPSTSQVARARLPRLLLSSTLQMVADSSGPDSPLTPSSR